MTKKSGDSAARRTRFREILDAATSVFSQKGYATASLQEIADRVGMEKGSLYYYIDSKESLLFQVLQASSDEATELMREVDGLGLPTEEKFCAYVSRLVTWYFSNRERASIYQIEWRFLEGEYGRQVRTQRRLFSGYLRAIIEAAVAQGLAHPGLDSDLASRFVLSSIDNIPSWYRAAPASQIAEVATALTTMARDSIFAATRT
jgi:TetR/AcrR family transcriptional regulator, cholesterol catabolism regulator